MVGFDSLHFKQMRFTFHDAYTCSFLKRPSTSKISPNVLGVYCYFWWFADIQVSRIQQDNEHKESTLWAYHKEELQPFQSHAENGLRKVSDKFH